jgi:hypothetical protein
MATQSFRRYEREVAQLLGGGPAENNERSRERTRFDEDSGSEEAGQELGKWVNMMERDQEDKESESDVDESEETGEFPFAPRISMKSRELWNQAPQEPIHMRYMTELSKKERKIKQLKEQIEKESKQKEEELALPVTKQQKIEHKMKLERSQKKAHTPNIYERKNIYDSGMTWLKNKNSKLAEKQTDRLESELAELQFEPSINKNNGYYATISKSFEKRQKKFEEEKKLRHKKLEQDVYNRYEHSPHINSKSKKLAERKKMEEEITKKADILKKMIKDEEIEINDEETIWKTAPDKSGKKDMWETKTITVSDFNASQTSMPLKKKGIHDLKSYEPKITNRIITKIPEDDFTKSPSSFLSQGKPGPTNLNRPIVPKKSMGLISPKRVKPTTPRSPAKSEAVPKQVIRSARELMQDTGSVDKTNKPSTPQKKSSAKASLNF